jgi:hypothetical protein
VDVAGRQEQLWSIAFADDQPLEFPTKASGLQGHAIRRDLDEPLGKV